MRPIHSTSRPSQEDLVFSFGRTPVIAGVADGAASNHIWADQPSFIHIPSSLCGFGLLQRDAGRHLQLALVPVKVDEVTILGDDQPLPDLRKLGQAGAGDSTPCSGSNLTPHQLWFGLNGEADRAGDRHVLVGKVPDEALPLLLPAPWPLPLLTVRGVIDVRADLHILNFTPPTPPTG